MLPRLLLLLFIACWAVVDGRSLEGLPDTTIKGSTTTVEANSQCQCKMKCVVQLDCRGATYTSGGECHLLLGGTAGQGFLVPELGSSTWYRSSLQVAKKFFLTTEETKNGTFASQQSICKANDGNPANILTQQDFAGVQADILPQLFGSNIANTYYAWVALVKNGTNEYSWGDGTSIWSTGVFTAQKVAISPHSVDTMKVNGRVTKDGTISLMNTPGVNPYRVMCQRLTF